MAIRAPDGANKLNKLLQTFMKQGKRITLFFEKSQRRNLVKPGHDGTLLDTALKKSIAYSILSWWAN